MKKTISLIISTLLLINILFANSVFAAGELTVDETSSKLTYKVGEEIAIKGTCTANKDVVIRVYNDKNVLVLTDVIEAHETESGEYSFSGIYMPQTNTSANAVFKAVISSPGAANVEKDLVVTGGTPAPTGGGGGGGGGLKDTSGWEKEDKKQENTNNTEVPKQPQKPANEDTLNSDKIKEAGKQTTASGGAKFIDETTKATPKGAMKWESVRNTITVSLETMIANIGSKKISSKTSTNELVLNAASVSESDLKKYTDTENTLMESVKKNKIELNRAVNKEYIVNTSFKTSKTAKITVYKDFIEKIEKVGVETLTINDKNFRVSYTLSELKDMIGTDEKASMDIDASALSGSSKKLAVNFDTNKTQTVKISFPNLKGDAKYMAIVDEKGEPVGGRYNPATDAVEAKISASGVYSIVYNEKDFADIKSKSAEMQESIKILTAKGIIKGTSEKEFSPDDTITRADIAALLLRVLSKIDPNADGGFADVKQTDWFYGTAGSARNYGMIVGFEDNTFRGNAIIEKNQILAMSARILKKEMRYTTPDNTSEWLDYADAGTIAGWAKDDVALASMANIITQTEDNTINADENMTRGDAALIIMRLFYKIW